MKKGDKIRFTGEEWEYNATTKGKEYTIEAIDEVMATYRGDNDRNYFWYHRSYPNDFTLVPAQNAAPAERGPQDLQEGDMIKFMGAPANIKRYVGTTVGREYMIFRVVRDVEGNLSRVQYLDDDGDAISWHPNRYTDMYFFKVMNDGKLYKDDVLATAPTLQDLKTTLDMALLLNDIQWAQETYEQIQQMEGEHA